ncbi:hypothetical protein UPYG_G00102930 [Umbra pygmaea]|uniref:Uncharacterized protein n=1 Tax=Umbra pygmaea TaxID=75934 RepID=A0ABD0X1D8_UMBPY
MAKQKRQKNSIDDMLGDLLGDDDFPVNAKAPFRDRGRLLSSLPSASGKRSLFEDSNFFSKLVDSVDNDNEGSDVSEADPTALLASMKDIDDMDADLFESKKKPLSAPAQSKVSSIGGPLNNPPKSGEMSKGVLDEPSIEKPSSAPASTARGYKKFSFTDDDDEVVVAPITDTKDLGDPLADLLDDLSLEKKTKVKKTPVEKSLMSPQDSPVLKEKRTSSGS